VAGATGLVIVTATVLSAIRTVVVPRSAQARIPRVVATILGRLFRMRTRRAGHFDDVDRALALQAPLYLLVLPVVWLGAALVGFAAVYIGVGVPSVVAAIRLSGSSLTTLGNVTAETNSTHAVAVIEAVIGLGLVALLITYLPSIYAAFQRRELLVTRLEVRAGDPPDAVTMLIRHTRIGGLDRSVELFARWEEWFADVEETHTSQPALTRFRSPNPRRSWVTAAGAVLDGAALMASVVEAPPMPEAQLCLRAGYLSLRAIADVSGIDHPRNPAPGDPISVDRATFDAVVAQLEGAGVPLRPDRDQAWRDFAGWRVNYDQVLLNLAREVEAPPAPGIGHGVRDGG